MSEIKNGKYEDDFGGCYWYVNDELNRTDGPALISSNGWKYWYIKGKLHREDGPAFETPITNQWYLDGKRHREDGPAIENSSKNNSWWIDGAELTEEEFNQWLAKKQLNENLHSTLEEKPVGRKVKI